MMIHLLHAAFVYQAPDGEVEALRDVSLDVEEGEFCSMRFYYRRGGKGAAQEGFDRVYTEVDGDGNVLRELLAYVRADDSISIHCCWSLNRRTCWKDG